MKRIAHIENGLVVNISIWPDDYAQGENEVVSETAGIGDFYEDGVFLKPVVTLSQDALMAYLERRYQRSSDAGVAVEVSSGTALADTNDAGRTDINGLITMAMLGEDVPPWHQSTGDLTLDLDDLKLIGKAVAAHRSAAVQVYSDAMAAINAGTLTSFAEIDALVWP